MDMKKPDRRPRVLVTKVGLDGHSRGAYVIAHGLRQAGMEVIYSGIRQTAAPISAKQETTSLKEKSESCALGILNLRSEIPSPLSFPT